MVFHGTAKPLHTNRIEFFYAASGSNTVYTINALNIKNTPKTPPKRASFCPT